MAGQRPRRHAQRVDRSAVDNITIGMAAETTVTVNSAMTVGHFVANMPEVYRHADVILHMEMASGSAIASHLPEGFVSVGMDVKVRHRPKVQPGSSILDSLEIGSRPHRNREQSEPCG
jgi:predicted thioesterase